MIRQLDLSRGAGQPCCEDVFCFFHLTSRRHIEAHRQTVISGVARRDASGDNLGTNLRQKKADSWASDLPPFRGCLIRRTSSNWPELYEFDDISTGSRPCYLLFAFDCRSLGSGAIWSIPFQKSAANSGIRFRNLLRAFRDRDVSFGLCSQDPSYCSRR